MKCRSLPTNPTHTHTHTLDWNLKEKELKMNNECRFSGEPIREPIKTDRGFPTMHYNSQSDDVISFIQLIQSFIRNLR